MPSDAAQAPMPALSVVMPTFDQASFLPRAVASLLAQTLTSWELIIVDDGSTDATAALIERFLADPRIRSIRLERNRGLGAAVNRGLAEARAPLIAYLPSDDHFLPRHLSTLLARLKSAPDAVLAYSGVRFWHNQSSAGAPDGEPLQLVQVLHRATLDRWTERQDLVSDDLDRLFWSKLRDAGTFVGTGEVTCEWLDHPAQGHKVIRETPSGGLNRYRARYGVREPLVFHSSVGNRTDEVELYRRFRERPDTPAAADGLKILLVGELAYNGERILALEERGHRLYGLWTSDPYWFSTVGPVPFGHVRDVPRSDWQAAVRELRPDIIYALLNWQAVPLAHEVLTAGLGVPFVWHLKEGPWHCISQGTWNELVDLMTYSDGRIHSSREIRDWWGLVLPDGGRDGLDFVLDGDLPKREWFSEARAPRLSEQDGEIHTVVPGRMMGVDPSMIGELAARGVHVHLHGRLFQQNATPFLREAQRLAPAHLHLHPEVDQRQWVSELSRYDAGWLHVFRSDNAGDLAGARWQDLNIPSRLATLACAGLPLIQRDNGRAVVASRSLADELDIGLAFSDADDLVAQLRNSDRMAALRTNAWRNRELFSFDEHADRLLGFFRRVLSAKQIAVPVTREEAAIERRPVGERPASGGVGSDDEVRVPLREEKVRIEKEPVVTEEISVGKRQRQDTERVGESVQREEAEIEGADEPEVRRG